MSMVCRGQHSVFHTLKSTTNVIFKYTKFLLVHQVLWKNQGELSAIVHVFQMI